MSINYSQSGVSIEAGDALVDWLKESAPKSAPYSDHIVSGIGGFASLFRLPLGDMKEPCLVTCTDGVGTKVKLASHFKSYQEVGQDLVAMCVNDLICTGGRPLLFLDYYATGHLELEAAKDFLTGVRNACSESNCLLVGGETAEMPGVYQKNDFDCAGFAVGLVDRTKTLGPENVKSGQALIGVASSGFHSNGFSLIRKLFAEDLESWRETLLRPTALYPKLAEKLMAEGSVKAIAHITGGGIDNLLRVLPNGLQAVLQSWLWPAEFIEVQKRAQISIEEMLKTFNCGLGLVLVVPQESISAHLEICQKQGHRAWLLGELKPHPDGSEAEVGFTFIS